MPAKTKAPAMTPAEATRFERISLANAAMVAASLTCDCSPYRDVFTYRRWKAQGYQVRRGEHGIKLSGVRDVEDKNGDSKKIFFGTTVFCRCQVDKCQQ